MAMEIKEYVGHNPKQVKEEKQTAVKKPAKKPAPKK
jgi:hypothetical protein